MGELYLDWKCPHVRPQRQNSDLQCTIAYWFTVTCTVYSCWIDTATTVESFICLHLEAQVHTFVSCLHALMFTKTHDFFKFYFQTVHRCSTSVHPLSAPVTLRPAPSLNVQSALFGQLPQAWAETAHLVTWQRSWQPGNVSLHHEGLLTKHPVILYRFCN